MYAYVKCSSPHAQNTLQPPVIETQDYDYLHRVKGADQIWSFRDDMCIIESQRYEMCTVCRKCMRM